jgi:molybdate transport system substrate-binding protein
MQMGHFSLRLFVNAAVISLLVLTANAAEITVYSSVGIRAAVSSLAQEFEQVTGNKVTVHFGTALSLERELLAQNRFDIAILTPQVISELSDVRLVLSATRSNIARVGVGVAYRSGDTPPDISTEPRFWKTIKEARSIAIAADGASGVYFSKLLAKNGIDLNTTLIYVSGRSPLEVVANGEAQLGIQLISEIQAAPGTALAGPFPASLQDYTTFTAAVATVTSSYAASQDFYGFLHSKRAADLFLSSGLDLAQ